MNWHDDKIEHRSELAAAVVGALITLIACTKSRAAEIIDTRASLEVDRTMLSLTNSNAVEGGTLNIEPPTLHSIGFEWKVNGDDNHNATVKLEYREKGSSTWLRGMPFLRTDNNFSYSLLNVYPGNKLAGSAVLLNAGRNYEFRLTLSDPDGGYDQRVVEATTRNVPRAYAGGRTRYVVPGSGGGSGTKSDPFRGLAAADAGAAPGDLFWLAAGTYDGVKFTHDGSDGLPIVYRGVDADSVVIDGHGGNGTFNLNGRSHIYLEQMRMEKSQNAITASNTTDIALKFLKIHVLESEQAAIYMWGDNHNNYICDNEIVGPLINFPRRTEHQAGMFITGEGHVVCHNRVTRFRDGFSTAFNYPNGDVPGRSIDFNNNFIYEVADDAIEADYSLQNIRIFRNKFLSFLSGISFQPSFSGPMYIFRNEFMNSFDNPDPSNPYSGSPFKLSSSSGLCPTGFLIFNNTSVNYSSGFVSGYWPNSTFRNNLIYGVHGPVIENFSGDPATFKATNPCPGGGPWSFDYDGLHAGIRFNIDGYSYAGLDAWRSQTGNEKHGFWMDLSEFKSVPNLAANTWWSPAEYDLSLNSAAYSRDRAFVIAGLNDGVADGRPDIGAHEYGEPSPKYGPRAPGNDVEPGETLPPPPGPSPAPAPNDVTAPVISNVRAEADTTGVTISWDLNEPGTGQIEYGLATSYGSFGPLEPSFKFASHSQRIDNLLPGTLYHFRIRSQDLAGNLAVSGDFTFSTQGSFGADSLAPEVRIVSPADGEIVPRLTDVTVSAQ